MAKVRIVQNLCTTQLRKKSRLRAVVQLEIERTTQDLLELYDEALMTCPDSESIDSPAYHQLFKAAQLMEQARQAYRSYYRLSKKVKKGGVK